MARKHHSNNPVKPRRQHRYRRDFVAQTNPHSILTRLESPPPAIDLLRPRFASVDGLLHLTLVFAVCFSVSVAILTYYFVSILQAIKG